LLFTNRSPTQQFMLRLSSSPEDISTLANNRSNPRSMFILIGRYNRSLENNYVTQPFLAPLYDAVSGAGPPDRLRSSL